MYGQDRVSDARTPPIPDENASPARAMLWQSKRKMKAVKVRDGLMEVVKVRLEK